MRPRLIVIGPVPPPFHGVTISTKLVLDNPFLRERFSIRHLDTSDPRTIGNIGRWDATNLLIGCRNVATLAGYLCSKSGTVYFPLSQSIPAFLRDSLFVHLAALRGWKIAAHLRGSEFREFYSRQPRLIRLWIRFTLAKLDSMAVMGSSLSSVFDGLIAPERLAIVPNGTPNVERDGRKADPHTVLFLSNFLRRKGIIQAFEAALIVVKRHERAKFLFVGSWYDPTLELELTERTRNFGDRIRFLPPVTGDQKRDLLLSAGVLLFPPVEPEGHPRVVLEAMSAGLPLVTTNRGAIAETVVDGKAGFVLDEPIPEELAACVLQLLRDEGLRERMARTARIRYLERFTEEKADRKIADWLTDVAARGGHRRPDEYDEAAPAERLRILEEK